MRTLLLSLFLLAVCKAYSQDIEVKPVIFTNTFGGDSQSRIPMVVAKTNGMKEIADNINSVILEEFMIESFNATETEDFRWNELDYSTEIKSGILLISYQGEYYGAYSSGVSNNLYFDLSTGEQLPEKLFSTASLFSLNGYFSFLQDYWMPDCKTELETANECAGMEAFCNCNDFTFNITEDHINFELTGDCFPHVVQCCEPYYSISPEIESVKPYLSEFGINLILKSNYRKMSELEKFLFYKENQSKLRPYFFISGFIDNKYAFNMAFELDKNTNKVSGFYYYIKQQKQIRVEGLYESGIIKLTEMVDNKVTGRFEYTWNGDYENGSESLSGSWFNAEGKEFSVFINDIRITTEGE